MTKSILRYFIKIILMINILVLPFGIIKAQSTLHVSSMINLEIMDQKGPGYDLTLIYKGIWGIRFSQISNLLLHETTDEINNKVSRNSFEGDILIPTLLKTLDFKQFKEGPNKIFDFITAYIGVGYNQLALHMDQKEYSAVSNTLTSINREEKVNARLSALSFGIYGGEEILVIDLRLQFLKGEIEKSDYSDATEFSKWMIVASVGIGY